MIAAWAAVAFVAGVAGLAVVIYVANHQIFWGRGEGANGTHGP